MQIREDDNANVSGNFGYAEKDDDIEVEKLENENSLKEEYTIEKDNFEDYTEDRVRYGNKSADIRTDVAEENNNDFDQHENTIILPCNTFRQMTETNMDNSDPKIQVKKLKRDNNENNNIKDEIVFPVNPKKTKHSNINNNHTYSSVLKTSYNIPKTNRSDTHSMNFKNFNKPALNFNKKQKEDDDFFFQMFRHASNQNRHLQLLTSKICKVSNKSPEALEKKTNIENSFKNPKSQEKTKINQIYNLIEENAIIKPEKRMEKIKSNDRDYNLKDEKEKELYIENLKKSLMEFSVKKNENKKNRDDFLADLDSKLTTITKKLNKQEEKGKIINKFIDVFHSLPIDEYEKLKKKTNSNTNLNTVTEEQKIDNKDENTKSNDKENEGNIDSSNNT